MKYLQVTFRLALCAAIVLWSMPQSAQAALFTKRAEAAIVATDAEAGPEAAYVAPQANAGTTFFSTSTGITSLGNQFLGKLQSMMQQPATVETVPAPLATTPTVIDEQTNNNTGIAVVPFEADKAVAVGAPVVLMGEEKAASTIEEMIPVVPAEEAAIQQQAPAAEAATEDEEEKALFPLLWSGSGAGAAGAGAGAETGAVAGAGLFSTTGAKVVGIGLLLAAVALGIILPLTLSGGGGGGGSSHGGDADTTPPTTDPFVPPIGSNDPKDTKTDPSDSSAPIPEPLTLILFGTGLIGLFLRKRND